MADILKELASRIPPYKQRMFELHSWVVDSVTAALRDKEHPLSQKELAERMGIDPASLSRSLSFKGANLTFETVGKFEEAIGRRILRTKADVKHEIEGNLSEAQGLLSRAQQRSSSEQVYEIRRVIGSSGRVLVSTPMVLAAIPTTTGNTIKVLKKSYGKPQEAIETGAYTYDAAAA